MSSKTESDLVSHYLATFATALALAQHQKVPLDMDSEMLADWEREGILGDDVSENIKNLTVAFNEMVSTVNLVSLFATLAATKVLKFDVEQFTNQFGEVQAVPSIPEKDEQH